MGNRKKGAEGGFSIHFGTAGAPAADADSGNDPASQWIPAVDIYETDRHYVLTAELPGVARNDLQICVGGAQLSISGERQFDPFCSQETCSRMETMRGPFHRTFTMPENLDSSEISAHLKNGILEVRVCKSSKAIRIPVKNSNTEHKR